MRLFKIGGLLLLAAGALNVYAQTEASLAYRVEASGRVVRPYIFPLSMNYKSLDIQKIRCVIRSCPDGFAVTDLIARSGADPLRVYPILFELEHSGWLEVTERGEWGAPRWVKMRIK